MLEPTAGGAVVGCVEDEPDIDHHFLWVHFRAAGFDVVHIDPDDEDTVVDAVREHHPDAILLDLVLRGFRRRRAGGPP